MSQFYDLFILPVSKQFRCSQRVKNEYIADATQTQQKVEHLESLVYQKESTDTRRYHTFMDPDESKRIRQECKQLYITQRQKYINFIKTHSSIDPESDTHSDRSSPSAKSIRSVRSARSVRSVRSVRTQKRKKKFGIF